MGDGACSRILVSRNTRTEYCGAAAAGYLVCIYLVASRPCLGSHNSADSKLPAGTRLVREIRRRHLDFQPSPQDVDDDAAERRIRQGVEALRRIVNRYVAIR